MPVNIDIPRTIDLNSVSGRIWLVSLVNAINNAVSTSTIFNDSEGNPANVGSTADGTSTYAARRDHVHAIVLFLDSEGNPAAIGTSADGTSVYAARRDHVHAFPTAGLDAMFKDSEGNPANIGTAADGTSLFPARRDHVHLLNLGAALTTALTSITHTEPGTPDYNITMTATSPIGFSTMDEALTLLKAVKTNQTRLDELEDRFQALGSLP